MKTLTFIRFIYENVRCYNNSIDYTFTITKTTKFIQFSIYSQLYLIYNKLKIEFCCDFIISTEVTIMNAFLKKIKVKKEI